MENSHPPISSSEGQKSLWGSHESIVSEKQEWERSFVHQVDINGKEDLKQKKITGTLSDVTFKKTILIHIIIL